MTAAAARSPVPHPEPTGRPQSSPDPAETRYQLSYTDPTGPDGLYGRGWTLHARHRSGWSWSASLDARGAEAHASAQLAQTAAVRMLGEQDVRVVGWTDVGLNDLPMFAAVLDPAMPRPRSTVPLRSHPPRGH